MIYITYLMRFVNKRFFHRQKLPLIKTYKTKIIISDKAKTCRVRKGASKGDAFGRAK